MGDTDKAFPEALEDLLREREWSNRQLATATRKRFDWGSHGTIGFLLRRELAPSRRAMEVIAATLQVRPSHFAEYRLLRARDLLDPSEVGLEVALRNLAENPRLDR